MPLISCFLAFQIQPQVISKLGTAEERLVGAAVNDGVADLSNLAMGSFPLHNWKGLPKFVAKGSLRKLVLDGNELQSLSPALGQLVTLRDLRAETNRLIDVCPEVGLLTRLETLHLSRNNLKAFPEAVRGLGLLRSLHLDHNPLLSSIPDWLSDSCPLLEKISLQYCSLLRFPIPLVPLKCLQSLRLSGNRGLILPETLGSEAERGFASSLKELHLSDLGLHEGSLECIAQLTALCCLELRRNELVTLPGFIIDLKHLTALDVSL